MPACRGRADSEALGQLGQDEPASGMALEPLVTSAPISGSVAIALHHRNSEGEAATTPFNTKHQTSKGSGSFLRIISSEGREVCLRWAT